MSLPFAAHIGRCFTHRFVAAPATFEVVRYFNTAGPCYPELHSMVSAEQRLPEAPAASDPFPGPGGAGHDYPFPGYERRRHG